MCIYDQVSQLADAVLSEQLTKQSKASFYCIIYIYTGKMPIHLYIYHL